MDKKVKGKLLNLLDELITHQEDKVKKIGQRLCPQATADDLLNPQDIPALCENPQFNYEEGYLAGLRSVSYSIKAEFQD